MNSCSSGPNAGLGTNSHELETSSRLKTTDVVELRGIEPVTPCLQRESPRSWLSVGVCLAWSAARADTPSNDSGCVEWALENDGEHVRVRHSKEPPRTFLRFTLHEWRAFVGGVRQGQADY